MNKYIIVGIMAVLILSNAVLLEGAQGTVGQPAPGQTINVPTSTPYAITVQDGNSRTWQQMTYTQLPSGEIVTNTHSYQELASGLNHLVNGKWVESSENIEIQANGTAAATNGQHHAYFPENIYQGQIELVTPDGQQLYSRPTELSYFDGTNSVMIAELTNSIGQVLGNNQVIYTNAFTDFAADLIYTYTKGGFEQDIVLRQQPPTPESFGLNPETARLQVLTEFFDPPQPSVQSTAIPPQAGVVLTDHNLGFGEMQMIPGKAFALGTNSPSVSVAKSWQSLEGRQFLVEEVPVDAIVEGLAALPLPAARNSPGNIAPSASRHLTLPAQRLVKTVPVTKSMILAKTSTSAKGLVLDYQIVTGTFTGFTFQGDTTYYIGGTVNLWGTNIFEGGTVIKYTNSSSAELSFHPGSGTLGPLICQTGPYRPAIFTSMDDNSVGDPISGGTGSPTTTLATYLANPIAGNFSGLPLHDLRFAYAGTAVFQGSTTVLIPIRDCQFVQCTRAIQDFGVTVFSVPVQQLYNVLMSKCGEGINDQPGCQFIVDGENMTVDQMSILLAGGSDSLSGVFTNCIFTGVSFLSFAPGGSGTITLYDCVTNSSGSGIYQTAGAGNYYLAVGSTNLNVATTNIDPTLLAELRQKTTYPPLIYSNVTISVNMTLSPQAQRDTDAPDLGYHYDSVDYLLYLYAVTNDVQLTINSGTAIANYNTAGILLEDGSSIVSIGTPLNPNWFVRYQSVQEQPVSLDGNPPSGGWPLDPYHFANAAPNGTFRFTKFACPAGGGYHLYDTFAPYFYGNLLVQDCEIWGGKNLMGGYSNTVTTLNNNLFWRSPIGDSSSGFNSQSVSNNLFYGISTKIMLFNQPAGTIWYAFNNVFDTCWVAPAANCTNGNNAYITSTNRINPTSASDIVLTNTFVYQTGSLGSFYQPTSSPLINMGSTTADQVGLYHYTTQTNQNIEGTSTVDMGYHYVATDSSGNLIDTNGDGVSDYLEDANGNGLVDGGESNWGLAILVQPVSQSVIQTSNAVFTVTAAGVAPLSYQWYFNSAPLANATNATLTVNNVQTNNAGTYDLIVSNSLGSITSSNAVLTVLLLPTISITNPANNSLFIASQTNLALSAIAADGAGTITQVQFYQGVTNLGVVSTPPYNLTWSNAPAGNYGLTAIALDNSGHSATSAVVNITISPLFATNTMSMWLKADAITGLTNNASIATWPDSSGWNNNATQGNATIQPSYVTNALNGLPVVHFNGSQVFGLTTFMRGLTGMEVLVVLNLANPTNLAGLWSVGNNSGNETYPYTDGSIHEDFGHGSPYNLGVPATPLTQYHLYNVTAASNHNWAAWVNGQLLYENTNSSLYFPFNPPSLGGNGNGGLNGNIAEVLIFNRGLTAGERMTINGYLNGKYGLVPAVPATPTNLVANAISPTQVELTWDEVLNGGVTQIAIERSTTSNGVYQVVAQVSSASSYIDTNLTAGTTYYYEVQAVNVTQWSPVSNIAQATTLTTGADLPFGSLVMWLKADAGLIQSTNTPIGYWADQSGNWNDAVQFTKSSQPFLALGTIGDRPAVHFSGGQLFGLDSFLSGLTGAEVFVVLDVATNPPVSTRALWYMGENNSDEMYPNTDGTIHENFGSTFAYNVGVPAMSLTQYHLYNITAPNNHYWAARINSQLLYETTQNTINFPPPSNNPKLGANANPFNGNIAEVLIFNRGLTAGERMTINGYLNGKYGLVPAVPATPTNLVANAISPAQVELTWDEVLNGGVTQIAIERSTTSNGVYQVVAQVSSASSYIDTNLTAGTTYYYEVQAVNVTQWSPVSNIAQATTLTTGADLPFGSLVMWLKADAGLVQGSTNTPVSFWADQSGNENDAVQAGTTQRPLWVPGVIGDRPVVKFSGGQSLGFTSFLNGLTGAEVLMVLNVSNATNMEGLWYVGGNSSGEAYPNTGRSIVENFGTAYNLSSGRNLGIPIQPLTQYHLYNISAQADNWAAWINSQLLTQAADNALSFPDATHDPTLGVNGNGNFNGNVAEILIFDRALTGDERVATGKYLSTKYNLSQYATNSTPPGTPTNLIATGVTPYQINLHWTATSNYASGFVIERKIGASGTYQEAGSAAFTNFLDVAYSPTNQIFYRVKACNIFGDSAYSAEISPPMATMTNPPAQSFCSTGTNVTVGATASDFYGTVKQVNFWVNNTLFFTATNAPYSCSVTNLVGGLNTIMAQPVDSLGNSAFSTAMNLVVSPDSDGDGINDFQEILMGTDPTNPLDPGTWTPPSSSTAPTINLLDPDNAVLLP